jgi:hypothetical protein
VKAGWIVLDFGGTMIAQARLRSEVAAPTPSMR